jgi:predicted nucleotide-binding protein (sugar kinase/HSP70/actin superfamily)
MSKTIEELLKLIEERPTSGRKPRGDNKDVVDFINELGVESGTEAVPNYLIFYVYRCIWKPDESKKKAKKVTFFQTFGKRFPDYRKNHQRYYMLKPGLFNVDEEILKAAKQYDKQHWKSKKSQKKISIPE